MPTRSQVTLGDFALKKAKLGRGICKNQFGRNKICCAESNHNYMSNMCEKEFLDRTLIKKLLAKYRFFKKLP